MKAILNDGTEIDCSVQEFLELKKNGLVGSRGTSIIAGNSPTVHPYAPRKKLQQSISTPKGFKPPTVSLATKRYRRPVFKFSDADVALIRTNASVPGIKLAEMVGKPEWVLHKFLDTHYGGLRKFRKSLGLKQQAPNPGFLAYIKRPKTSEELEKNKRTLERGRYVNNMTRMYINKYGWSYEKSYNQARRDLENGKPLIPSPTLSDKKTSIPNEPKFINLTPEGNSMLLAMIKNVIANKSSLNFRDVQQLPLVGDGRWSRDEYLNFLEEFAKRSPRIAEYFMSPNKFKVITEFRGFEVIRYE